MTRDQMDVVTDLLDRHRDQIAELTAQRDELLSVVKWIKDNRDKHDPNTVFQMCRVAIAKIETNQSERGQTND
jgi:uncharacterized coiled-coil DUF342 family protein